MPLNWNFLNTSILWKVRDRDLYGMNSAEIHKPVDEFYDRLDAYCVSALLEPYITLANIYCTSQWTLNSVTHNAASNSSAKIAECLSFASSERLVNAYSVASVNVQFRLIWGSYSLVE